MSPLARKGLGVGAMFLMAAVVSSCGDDATAPTLDEITRHFWAVTLTTSTDGIVTDQLAEGASLNISLHEDGTTTGMLIGPDADVEADLTGTYSYDVGAARLTFDHAADTFIREMTFTVARTAGEVQLEGEEEFGRTVVRVVLQYIPTLDAGAG